MLAIPRRVFKSAQRAGPILAFRASAGCNESEFDGAMHVLIVEDHENSREELKRCLTQHGHDVTAAGDLRSAVQSLGKRPFDVIISDIALPDGTGYALISQVHRRGLDPLCIAVSGYPFPPDVREPGATGFHHHVQKPLDWEHICSLLKNNADPGSRERLLNAFSARHR